MNDFGKIVATVYSIRLEARIVAVTLSVCCTQAFSAECHGSVERIFDNNLVSVEVLLASMPPGTILVLGERHGLVAHPQAAACFLDHLAERGNVSLVLEQITADRQPALDRYRSDHPEYADGLGTTLRWWESGWPRWSVYEPLFAAAWRTRTTVIAGDRPPGAPKPTLEALTTITGSATGKLLASWTQTMTEARCGMISADEASGLAMNEEARDQAFAQAVAAIPSNRFAVFYGGRSHVRKDVSVPFILSRLVPARPVISIALHEERVGGVETNRAKVLAEARGRYDYVWFVGEAENGDICADLRAKSLIP